MASLSCVSEKTPVTVRKLSGFTLITALLSTAHAFPCRRDFFGRYRMCSLFCISISVLSSFVLQVWVGGFWLQHCRLYFSKSSDDWIYNIPLRCYDKTGFQNVLLRSIFTFKIACIDLKYNIEQPLSSTALKMEISANMFHHVLLRTSRRMLSRKSGRWLSRCQDGSRHLLFCKYNLFCLEKCVCVCFLKITYGIKLSCLNWKHLVY